MDNLSREEGEAAYRIYITIREFLVKAYREPPMAHIAANVLKFV